MNTWHPLLVTKGILSDAEDVRKFSLSTAITVCRKAGPFLAPRAVDIVTTLLYEGCSGKVWHALTYELNSHSEGLSVMEPQMLNYLSFHAEKHGITQEQLETTRANATKMSPMMESIELCIEHLDGKSLEVLTPKLTHLIRKGVGLPTKVES